MDASSCPHCGLAVKPGEERCRACGWPAPRVLLASNGSTLVPPGAAVPEGPVAAHAAASEPAQVAVPVAASVMAQVLPQAAMTLASDSPRSSLAEAMNTGAGQAGRAAGYPVYPQGGHPGFGSSVAYPPSPQYYAAQAQPQPPAQPRGLYPYSPYPQGYPQPGSGGQPNPQGSSPYPYYQYYYVPAPRRPRGETHALVVSWLVIVGGGLAIVGGLLSLAILALTLIGDPDSLPSIGLFGLLGVVAIGGGTVALISGISRLLGRPSRRFAIPSAGVFVALALVVLATGLVLWNIYPAPGAALAVFPLTALAAILPSLGILAFTAHRLGDPSTRRRVWLSLFYGATLAPIVAIILELIATVIIYLLLLIFGQDVGNALGSLGAAQNPAQLLAQLLDVSLTAAIVEEGVKPLAAVLMMRRLRSPAEAFLVGLAGGIGFNIFEATGYITGEQADWISQGLLRSGAGLLHGVGAGMAALGWYYLINGKGVPLRWLRGFGGILYAVVQHATFNGIAVLIQLVTLPILAMQVVSGVVPLGVVDVLFLGLDALILVVLIYVTGRLRRSTTVTPGSNAPPAPAPYPYPSYPNSPALPVTGGAR